MDKILLKHLAPGNDLEAVFLPSHGMNMISFKKNGVEVIDSTTFPIFEERMAGLGALIGPHFHRRKTETLPVIPDESLFPHIARVKQKGVMDPFSHGIGRYAPWKTEVRGNHVSATLSGSDVWNGVPLSVLEGQNFKMNFEIDLKENGLFLELSVVSDRDSVVGIHYYYRCPKGEARVISSVQNEVIIGGQTKPMPIDWPYNDQHQLVLPLDRDLDVTFHPYPNPLSGTIMLETEEYHLCTTYSSANAENAWQLYHPKGESFVCIEPVSACDPRHPNLTVSSLAIHLEIK